MTSPGMRRRSLLTGGLGTVVLSFGPAQLAWGSAIVAVRVWPAADYTRVTIESDQALPATHFVADNPYRLVVDIESLELSAEDKARIYFGNAQQLLRLEQPVS